MTTDQFDSGILFMVRFLLLLISNGLAGAAVEI